MPEEAPSREAGEQVNPTVTIDGTALDLGRLVAIETWSEANRIPRARLVFYDGQPDTQEFPLSESAGFAPGSKVVIAVGYGSASKTIHSGIIVRHALRIVPGTAAQLVIESADVLLPMTLSRNSAVSPQKSDKDVIAALVLAHGGTVEKNQASATAIEALVQHHACDWDLLLMRAEANGCIALVEAGNVDIVSPTASESPDLMLEYGDSIVSLEAVIDAAVPFPASAVSGASWSYNQQKMGQVSATDSDVTTPGNLTPKKLAAVFDGTTAVQRSGAYVPDAQLGQWATAALLRSRLGAVRGEVRFQGNADIRPGGMVSLAGLGARFNGSAFVGSVRHAIRDGGWETVVGIGLPPESFASARQDIAAPPAAGLLPPMRGFHTGIVKQVASDPSNNFRVLVTLPLVDPTNGVWARLPQFYASSGFGAVFYPEVGDEVVLGFMDEDPGNPIILGSLYSSQRTPDPATQPNDENDTKAIVTRNGKLRIVFNDKDTIFTILTDKGRTIVLDDKEERIEISDKFNNKIVMTKESVDILSGAKLNLESKAAMTITSGATLAVSAKAGYTLDAATIDAQAKGTLSLQSDGPGTIKATAPLTIQGAIVKIN